MATAYVFDITGELITQAADRFESNAVKKAAEAISVYGNVEGQWIRTSNEKEQHCIDGKYFISLNKNFEVNYYAINHNPLRYNWRGHMQLYFGIGETETGIIYPNEIQIWNQYFLAPLQCLRPFSENLEITENEF